MGDTVSIGKCLIDPSLHYRIDDHAWVRFEGEDLVTVGITDVAENMAGPVLHVYPRKKGPRKKGQSLATIESGKWVGPLKAPLSGEILEANPALEKDPGIVNRSPYEEGWIVKMKPTNLDEEKADFVTGDEAVSAYRKKLQESDLKACGDVSAA